MKPLMIIILTSALSCTKHRATEMTREPPIIDLPYLRNAISLDDLDYVISHIQDDPNILIYEDRYRSALHLACYARATNVITYLLEKGADKHMRDWAGNRPIDAAVFTGNHDVCEILRNNDHDFLPRDAKLMNKIIIDALWKMMRISFVEDDGEIIYLSINDDVPPESIITSLPDDFTILPFPEPVEGFVNTRINPFDYPSVMLNTTWVSDYEVEVYCVMFTRKYMPREIKAEGKEKYGYGLVFFKKIFDF